MLLSAWSAQDLFNYLQLINNQQLLLLGETKGVDQVKDTTDANDDSNGCQPVENLVTHTSLNVDEGTVGHLKSTKGEFLISLVQL
jgi:hypothetical protein